MLKQYCCWTIMLVTPITRYCPTGPLKNAHSFIRQNTITIGILAIYAECPVSKVKVHRNVHASSYATAVPRMRILYGKRRREQGYILNFPALPERPGQSRKYRPCPSHVPVRAMSRNFTGYSQLPLVLRQFQFQPFFHCSLTTISTILNSFFDSRRFCAVSIASPASAPRIFTLCACASQ